MTSGLVVRHYGCPTASDAALCSGWRPAPRSLCVRVRHGPPPPTTKLLQVGVHHSAGKHPLPHGSSQLIQSRAARPRATAPFANGHRTHQARSSTPGFGFPSIRLQQQQQQTNKTTYWLHWFFLLEGASAILFLLVQLLLLQCLLLHSAHLRSFLSHSLLEREGVRAPGALGIWDKGAAQHSHPITWDLSHVLA